MPTQIATPVPTHGLSPAAQPSRESKGSTMQKLALPNPVPAAVVVGLTLLIWFVIPVPEGVSPNAWHLLALFIGTIVGMLNKGAKGRLDLVGERNGAPIFVDYAHKPDALEKALAALRPYVKRKLVVVFGAGGNRDAGKRPIMGAIAAQNADRVIVTDDNPRNEKPETIRAAILAAAPAATEIGDRREAIRRSVAALEPGDVLLIAGKGHESGQIIGDRVLEFSDHDEVEAALQEKVA